MSWDPKAPVPADMTAGELYHAGYSAYMVKEYDAALMLWTRGTEVEPKHVNAWNGVGLASQQLGRYEEAICRVREAGSHRAFEQARIPGSRRCVEALRTPRSRHESVRQAPRTESIRPCPRDQRAPCGPHEDRLGTRRSRWIRRASVGTDRPSHNHDRGQGLGRTPTLGCRVAGSESEVMSPILGPVAARR